MVKPMSGNTAADNKKEKSNKEENTTNKPSSSKIPLKSCQIKENVTKDLDTKENSSSVQSLVAPKTLLNGTTTPLWGCSRRSVMSSSVMINCPSPNNNSSSSLVLCSTTLGCLSNLPQPNQTEEGAELLVETEDRCGSYDDVVLEGDDGVISETEREFDLNYVSDFDSRCHVWEEPDDEHSAGVQVTLMDNIRGTVSVKNNFKTPKMISESSVLATKMRSHVNVSNPLREIRQNSTIPETSTCFAVPKTVTRVSNQHKTGLKTSLKVQENSDVLHKNSKTNTPFPFRHKPFIPGNTSTPFTSFAKPKAVITQHKTHKQAPKSSFTIYSDPAEPSRPSTSGSFNTSKNVLSSLSTNSSCTNRSSISATKGQRITSPLCVCGRRAKRQVVSNGGPNHGRGFYCCPVRRSGSGGRIQKGCEFFKWESALMKSPAAAGSSVSLCQINSTLSCRPPQRSTLRKSC